MNDQSKCGLCGEPMPAGEEMFKYHGYSGPCPVPRQPIKQKISEASQMKGFKWLSDMAAWLETLDSIWGVKVYGLAANVRLTVDEWNEDKKRLEAVIGWREHDWPEWFDRRTAEAVADLGIEHEKSN